MEMNIKKAVELILIGLGLGLAVWMITSTINVVAHNSESNYEYSKANFWEATVDNNSDEITETETEVITEVATEEKTEQTTEITSEASHTVRVVVVDCIESYGDYEVTVEDSEGNLWAYYDSEWLPNGYPLRATFNGDEIVDVAY